ncbi:MAG: PilZ domain-containing protein [Thermodesulfobacteriota bacterium]
MGSGSNSFDSRKCQRYQVKDGVIALDSVFGELIDISFGGLSFRYNAYENLLKKPAEFGIIFGGETLYFDNVPLESVSDLPLDDDSGGATRRCGMKFGELGEEELAVLARFIRNHTTRKG